MASFYAATKGKNDDDDDDVDDRRGESPLTLKEPPLDKNMRYTLYSVKNWEEKKKSFLGLMRENFSHFLIANTADAIYTAASSSSSSSFSVLGV